ncbi:MAG: glycosyltransferase family 39 protein [Actinomycetota bacterium]|nr:glycosyltransferase family 39 protein [Actinomycetota bacterium]
MAVPAGRATAGSTRRIGFAQGVLIIGLVALALRVVVVLATPHFATIDDSHSYDRMAVSLAEHGTLPSSQIPLAGGPTAYPPPGYPVALAIAYRIVGVGSEHTRWEAGRIEEAVLGAIVVVLIALIASRLFGRAAGLLSGEIAAVYPPLLLVGSSLMSESLFIPLVLGAVLTALVARDSEHRLRWAISSGVLIGLAALTRSNGIVLVLPVILLVWTERPRWSRRAVRTPLVVVAATILTIMPWTIRNTVEFHELVPISTETGYAFAGTYNAVAQYDTQYPALWTPPGTQIYSFLKAHPRANEAQISDDLVTFSRRYIAAHPSYPFVVAYWSTVRLFNLAGPGYERFSAPFAGYPPTLAYWSVFAFWLLAVVALIGLAIGGWRRAPWALWACPVLILLSTLPFAGLTRYRAPADPFFVMLAALALLVLWRRTLGRRLPSPAA